MINRKIVFITSGIQVGGAEKQLALLAKALKAHEFEPLIISLSKAKHGHALADFEGLKVIECDFKADNKFLNSLAKLRKILRTHNPEIIQGWMYAGNIAASIAGLGLTSEIFHSIRASNMDSKRYGNQIWLNSKLSIFANAVIANSQNGALHHISKGFPEKKMQVIFNGIDSNQYFIDRSNRLTFRKSIGLTPEDIVFLYVARVDPMKGHEFLISAARSCPEFKFIFVGNGTKELKLPENIIPLGIMNDMRAIYNSADWAINWSHFGEGFPNVIGEAMSCGLPVYSNNVGDSWHLLGDTGRKSRAKTPEELAQDLTLLAELSVSHSDRLRMSERIRKYFSVDAMASAYLRAYKKRCH